MAGTAVSMPFAPPSGSADTPSDVQQRASCVIQVDGDEPDLQPMGFHQPMGFNVARGARLDASAAAMLLSSTALSEPAVEAVLKQKPGLVGRQVLIVATLSGNRFLRLEVSLKQAEKPWAADAANTLMLALVDRLRAAAKQSQQADSAALQIRLGAASRELDDAQARRQHLAELLADVDDALDSPAGYGYAGGGRMGPGTDPTVVIRQTKMERARIEADLVRLKRGSRRWRTSRAPRISR